GVVADAANAERPRRVAEMVEPDAGDADVDCFSLDVKAVRRDAAVRTAALPQQAVGFRRAIAGNHVERLIGVQYAVQLEQQVEQLRIDRLDGIRAEIAQQMIDAAQRRREGLPGAEESGGNRLPLCAWNKVRASFGPR